MCNEWWREPIDPAQRRWPVGREVEVRGVVYRTVPGSKGPNDVVLLAKQVEPRWLKLDYYHIGIPADALWQNEHILNPPNGKVRGGQKMVEYIELAARLGWEEADRVLQAEKLARQESQEISRKLGYGRS